MIRKHQSLRFTLTGAGTLGRLSGCFGRLRRAQMTTSEKPFFTRRHIVGGAGVGLAASVAPALAQGSRPMAKEQLQNPVDKYPKPTFKKQSQPWPGLASKMDPPP